MKRVGIKGSGKTLTQTAHVLHKNGRYYIVHFRQMFMLDGLCDVNNFSDDDRARVESIAYLLNKWGLVKLITAIKTQKTFVYVIPFAEKSKWVTRSNYTIGRKKHL